MVSTTFFFDCRDLSWAIDKEDYSKTLRSIDGPRAACCICDKVEVRAGCISSRARKACLISGKKAREWGKSRDIVWWSAFEGFVGERMRMRSEGKSRTAFYTRSEALANHLARRGNLWQVREHAREWAVSRNSLTAKMRRGERSRSWAICVQKLNQRA